MRTQAQPRLTIGLATYDDFDGVYFTITSLMLHHPEVHEDCEIVVIDNNPDSAHGRDGRKWVQNHVPQGTYYPFPGPAGTAQPRNEVFRRATGHAVLCLDCHVLLAPGCIGKLLDYYAAHPDTADLLTGPLISDSGEVLATHQEPVWRGGSWGVWARDERGCQPDGDPFEIWQQGMGLFSCLRQRWVGFHPDFRGFGGCESYLMEKVRRQGGAVLCCPWLRWTHRFARPAGVPYPLRHENRKRNYEIGFQELGLDTKPLQDHFQSLNGNSQAVPHVRTDNIHVVGNRRFGAVNMRGVSLAKHYQCRFSDPDQVNSIERCQTIIAVKGTREAQSIRRKCERLIYDPLDSFPAQDPMAPGNYWRQAYELMHFDDILATSPACHTLMKEALPASVQVHLVEHHADPRINETWYDKDGPVVYAGYPKYVESRIDLIRKACELLGSTFRMGTGAESLRGASAVLALRLAPYDTALSRFCKPQVKIANALAARMPVVSTPCPAALSLYPHVATVPYEFTPDELAEAMQLAGAQRNFVRPSTLNNFFTAVDRVLGRETRVIYTAIFGDRDELREPIERLPGVQYICFTDNPRLRSATWSIRYCPASDDPLMQAKRLKILAHEAVDCDVSLWIDGRITLRGTRNLFDATTSDVAMQAHPARRCIYEEAEHCKGIRKGNPARIDEAVRRYASEGHPQDAGLWYGGLILRRHSAAVRQFNEMWWNEITTGTTRDQISLPVVLKRSGVPFETMPNGLASVSLHQHAR